MQVLSESEANQLTKLLGEQKQEGKKLTRFDEYLEGARKKGERRLNE